MKTFTLAHSIRVCLLAVALATPVAFAQSDTTTPPPTAPPHNGTMQEGATPPVANTAVAPASAPTASTADKPKTWKELDINKDGKLSKDEAAGDSGLAAVFDTADTNRDGYISKVEYKKYEDNLKKIAKTDDSQDGKK
jgi:hypothetical protein